MARIALRAYTREIDNLIENGQIDQAIAHCRHILKSFPKHVDTYRLLGKAYLEGQRYSDAADILQRVLSSVPYDFIAHLGMSIIREDEGNLDEAIWHMERAFEVQPSNSAIQDELRRLYGKRDGMEPPKVRLTRGALARMYAKGALYSQAISELRAALAEDPGRIDLQVLLGQVYAQAGMHPEAAEICTQVLRKLPYCLDANEVMVQVIPSTRGGESSDVYRTRLYALDPYSAHVSELAPTSAQVPDQAVTLERFEWTPGMSEDSLSQPDWAASLGVEISGMLPGEEEQLPDWLTQVVEQTTAQDEEPAAAFEEGPAFEEQQDSEPGPAADAEIPDWIKEAGWGPASGEFDEAAAGAQLFDDSPAGGDDEAPAVSAEIPDWLRELAPDSELEPQAEEEADEIDQDLMAWLENAPEDLVQGASIFADMESEAGEDAEPAEAPAEEEPPAWLEAVESEAPEAVEEDIPAWLRDLETPAGEPAAPEAEVEPEAAGMAAEVPAEPEDIPNWLRDFEETAAEPAAPEAEVEPETAGAAAEVPAAPEDIPEWLRDYETPAGEVETAPAAEEAEVSAAPEDVPEWLQDLEGTAEEAAEAPAVEGAEDAGLPDWLREIGTPAEEPEPSAAEEPLPAFSAEETPGEEWADESGEEPLAGIETDLPEWLREFDTAEQSEAGLGAAAAEEPFAWEAGAGFDTETPAFEEEELASRAEDLPDWLKNLGEAEVPGDEEELTPVTPVEPLPDWLQNLDADELIEGDTQPVRLAGPAPESAEEEVEQAAETAEAAETAGAAETAAITESEFAAEQPAAAEESAAGAGAQDFPVEAQAPEAETEAPAGDSFDAGMAPEDMDAAFAWLESLAVKQGADEALLLSPEERLETPPEWVQEAQSEDEAPVESEEPAVPEAEPVAGAWTFEVPAEPAGEWVPEEAAEVPFAEEEPAAAAGAAQELAEAEPIEPAAVESPEGEAGEYISLGAQVWEAQPAETEPAAEWVPEETSEEQPVELAPAEAVEAGEEAPAEESLPAEARLAAGEGEPEPSPEAAAAADAAVPAEAEPELPDWLAGAESSDEELEWTPPAPEAQPVRQIDLNQASLAELERLPGMGFILAQAIINHREHYGPFTSVEDLASVPEITPEMLEELRPVLMVSAVEPAAAPEPEPETAEEPTVDMSGWPEAPDAVLAAREPLAQGAGEEAAQRYNELIRQRQHLPEVLRDLEEAVRRYPQEFALWQALGDAYLRSDQLTQALQAYEKAEALLK
ncbi:MAG: tetratricopeptide repeat protein [Chloroflexi bacterium]|jgi:competence ComEA-like helix-hairpin-helix protein|nr:tetratricopeptide repeat protein [Chloroflexota bacterium]